MNRASGIQWGAVALGWLAAIVTGLLLYLILGGLFGLTSGLGTVEPGTLTAGAGIAALIFGFLSYLVGGYVAGSRAGTNRPVNGAMTAVFNLIVGLILAILLALLLLLTGGDSLPSAPVNFGAAAGGGFITVLIGFLVNLAGGYLGGRLSEARGR